MATVFPITGHGCASGGIAGPFYPFYVECRFPDDKDAGLNQHLTDSRCSNVRQICYVI